ncbi:MAG: hypothetical protein V8R14_03815 [Clostridia bacterium]
MNTPAGVKMLLSSENEDIPELLAITENVLMIASFAESRAIIADAACQLQIPAARRKVPQIYLKIQHAFAAVGNHVKTAVE